jgi:hypothetical protein
MEQPTLDLEGQQRRQRLEELDHVLRVHARHLHQHKRGATCPDKRCDPQLLPLIINVWLDGRLRAMR